ncbi:MAG: uncharacterized protein A8A55_0305 [Amphiamblys sp. WSBS2006]|nr:MAG: uncharacterized protein A8A55_0305 [Amphiamblys sp. WSBS2006]
MLGLGCEPSKYPTVFVSELCLDTDRKVCVVGVIEELCVSDGSIVLAAENGNSVRVSAHGVFFGGLFVGEAGKFFCEIEDGSIVCHFCSVLGTDIRLYRRFCEVKRRFCESL